MAAAQLQLGHCASLTAVRVPLSFRRGPLLAFLALALPLALVTLRSLDHMAAPVFMSAPELLVSQVEQAALPH
jgi:hypothetical protein